jgi:hypothetical protein
MGSKIFYLPNHIKSSQWKKFFKKTLQRFLIDNVFYSIDEFLNFNVNWPVALTSNSNIIFDPKQNHRHSTWSICEMGASFSNRMFYCEKVSFF